jgi:hypothetical protein
MGELRINFAPVYLLPGNYLRASIWFCRRSLFSMYKIATTILLAIIVFAIPAQGQHFPLPAVPDTSQAGRYIQRTMHLLASSTQEKKNTVKILVYGQSISEQSWWLEVKRDISGRFPNAHITMENKSIGGFSSSILVKTVEMDVSSFYPDLVLFHVYGDQTNYEAIIKTIRSRTAAEVVLQTDHYNKKDDYSDKMAYEILISGVTGKNT